jgi:hypothetical protein
MGEAKLGSDGCTQTPCLSRIEKENGGRTESAVGKAQGHTKMSVFTQCCYTRMLTPEWLTAVGTIGLAIVAVALALFEERVKRLLVRPKLGLDVRVARPDADKTRWTQQVGTIVRDVGEVYYFRLAIRNAGSAAANDVQVFLASVEREQDGQYVSVRRFIPMNLCWANAGGKVTRPVLLPDMPPVYCDMAHVGDPRSRNISGENLPDVPAGDAVLGLDLEVKPYSMGHLLEPGTYRFRVILAASNCPPRSYTLEIVFPGRWFEDEDQMFSIGFKMRVLN